MCEVCSSHEVMYINSTDNKPIDADSVVALFSGSSAIAVCIKSKQAKYCPECGKRLKRRMKNDKTRP